MTLKSCLCINSNAVSNAESALLSAQQQLDDTIITVPYDSVVSEVLVEPQEQVGALQPIVRILRQDTRSQIEVLIDESLATHLAIGSHHVASVPALSIDTLDVTLQEITANNSQLTTYRTTFVTNDVLRNAIDGLSATVSISITPSNTGFRWFIPHGSYLIMPKGEAYLFRIDEQEQRLEQVAIKIGDFNEEGVFVSGELKEGQWVVSRGVKYLSNGQTVHAGVNRPELINE
ncbi:efflux RND transporter periplasmic adaptor subunit [Alteromonas sp. P256]|uniref:efflux RND transporter periplasmic adaptor subunit n=1 Tax=Alteromonas sp. P256 TaxID=3117399 RepID=UPI002FE032C1